MPDDLPVRFFAIAHRDAVEYENETTVATDGGFLLGMDLIDANGPRAVLLFTSEEKADRFLASKKDGVIVKTSFRGPAHLVSCLDHWEWVMVDRVPGEDQGYVSTREEFLEAFRQWLASGRLEH
jgi:hypothetical protein